MPRECQIRFLEAEIKTEKREFSKALQSTLESLHYSIDPALIAGGFEGVNYGALEIIIPIGHPLPRNRWSYQILVPSDRFPISRWGSRSYQNLCDLSYLKTLGLTEIISSSDSGTRIRLTVEDPRPFERLNKATLAFLGPPPPPLEYLENLRSLSQTNRADPFLDLAEEVKEREYEILGDDAAKRVLEIWRDHEILILQGPPGTGKSFLLAELAARLADEGQSVLVTAMTNNALMEVAEKLPLHNIIRSGRVLKTGLTPHETVRLEGLVRLSRSNPVASSGQIVLTTFYTMSTWALNSVPAWDTALVDEASQGFLGTFAAVRKCGKKMLIVGDHCQIEPVIKLSWRDVTTLGANSYTSGFRSCIQSDRFGQPLRLSLNRRQTTRGTSFTAVFYGGTRSGLRSDGVRDGINLSKFSLAGICIPQNGGPILLRVGHDGFHKDFEHIFRQVRDAFESLTIDRRKCRYTVMACHVRTVRSLQRLAILPRTEVETVIRLQGHTCDVAFFALPRAGLKQSLSRTLFNVATSRARLLTVLVTDTSPEGLRATAAVADPAVASFLDALERQIAGDDSAIPETPGKPGNISFV